jgi:hypothetical protein
MTAPPRLAAPDTDQAGPASGQAAGDQGPAGAINAGEPTASILAGWRRWRLPLALIAVILLGGLAIAAISRLLPPPLPNSYLDPGSTSGDGSHALADLLGERGFLVVGAYSPASALTALGQGGTGAAPSRPAATLIITRPYLLTARQRARLSQARADLFLVEPGSASLAALAPGVHVAAHNARTFGQSLIPRCGLPAATLAGSANLGGFAYRAPARAAACYPVAGHPSLVRYRAGGRTVTILGSGAALTNGKLAANGNAALALNLLTAHRLIVWLTPEPALRPAAPPPGGRPVTSGHAAPSLIPWAAWLLVIQVGIAVMLLALWRGRRLGPLISERLPVIVRASETVEGHARLYQSRRARDRAAAALRDAMLRRVLPVIGLVRDSPAAAVTSALAARSRLGQPEISSIVYGPAPATDAELVRLARSLDELERQVRSQ